MCEKTRDLTVEEKLSIVSEEEDSQAVAEDIARSISKMYEDMDRKVNTAHQHLVNQLEVATDKYRTANGVMVALDTVREVYAGHGGLHLEEELTLAKNVATYMSRLVGRLCIKVGDTENTELLVGAFDELYDHEFASGDGDATELVKQLMVLKMCQNFGANAEDIRDFARQAETEIDNARERLMEYCDTHGLDFMELCGPHNDCASCLCMDCAKDCKENRQIGEGQSALDVCPDFERPED